MSKELEPQEKETHGCEECSCHCYVMTADYCDCCDDGLCNCDGCDICEEITLDK